VNDAWTILLLLLAVAVRDAHIVTWYAAKMFSCSVTAMAHHAFAVTN